MTTLRKLQQQFGAALLQKDAAIHTEIASSAISSEGRLRIYRRNVFGAVTGALRLTYPVIEKLVGREFFAATCREFIKSSPPISSNLDDYGAEFPAFLASFPPARTLPYLPDVARLEWLYHECSLASTEEESLRLLHSPYPVHRIWEINQEGADAEVTVNLEEGAVHLLLTRSEREVRIHILSEAEYHARGAR